MAKLDARIYTPANTRLSSRVEEVTDQLFEVFFDGEETYRKGLSPELTADLSRYAAALFQIVSPNEAVYIHKQHAIEPVFFAHHTAKILGLDVTLPDLSVQAATPPTEAQSDERRAAINNLSDLYMIQAEWVNVLIHGNLPALNPDFEHSGKINYQQQVLAAFTLLQIEQANVEHIKQQMILDTLEQHFRESS